MKQEWLYQIEFLDHCSTINGMNKPILCTVWGLIATQDKHAYYVVSWIADGVIDENCNTNTILKKTVTKMTKLVKVSLA